MSTARARKGGFCNPSALPKGPNGRALCRYCGTEVSGRRQTFCSDACVHEWKIRTNPGFARDQVFRRDHGKCAICGAVDHRWEADHIVPVVEGGGECGLENLRTLCQPCHRRETAKLAARRAAKRREGNAA